MNAIFMLQQFPWRLLFLAVCVASFEKATILWWFMALVTCFLTKEMSFMAPGTCPWTTYWCNCVAWNRAFTETDVLTRHKCVHSSNSILSSVLDLMHTTAEQHIYIMCQHKLVLLAAVIHHMYNINRSNVVNWIMHFYLFSFCCLIMCH